MLTSLWTKRVTKQVTKCQQSANKAPTINNNVKNYKNVKKKNICGKNSEAFERWWKIYPKRNGRRVGKKNAALQFEKIPESEWQELKQATENYAKECNGLPKDAERFLKKDFWKDFIKPSESTKPRNGEKKDGERSLEELKAAATYHKDGSITLGE